MHKNTPKIKNYLNFQGNKYAKFNLYFPCVRDIRIFTSESPSLGEAQGELWPLCDVAILPQTFYCVLLLFFLPFLVANARQPQFRKMILNKYIIISNLRAHVINLNRQYNYIKKNSSYSPFDHERPFGWMIS